MKAREKKRLKSLRASLLVTLALNGINPYLLCGPAFAHNKGARGQTMPLVAVVALVIVVLGGAIFFYIQVLGGSKEVQNAVDAGTLQVAKKALFAPRVQLTHVNLSTGVDEITAFGAAATAVKQIELANFPTIVPPDDGNVYIDLLGINAVWGLALLEALNVKRMQALGVAPTTNTSPPVMHAQLMQLTAADISTRLTQALQNDKDPTLTMPGASNPLDTTFRQLANVNSVRMLEQTGQIKQDDYANSFTYRGKDSNLQFNTDQLNLGLLALNNVVGGQPFLGTSVASGTFIEGYVPVNVSITGSQPLSFMFVPLDSQKKPHLISEGQFRQDADPSIINSPITTARPPAIPPNGFHFAGLANVPKASSQLDLKAFAAARDMTTGLVIQNPHGFIRIENYLGLVGNVPPANLHVIEVAEQQVQAGYAGNLNLLAQPAGQVLGRSLFNPVETIYSNSEYSKQATDWAAGICEGVSCVLNFTVPVDLVCQAAMYVLGFGFIQCSACCASWLIISFGVLTPLYQGNPFLQGAGIPGNDVKPMYGFLPAVSSSGSGTIHNFKSGTGQLCRITHSNEGQHKIFYDWLNGDTTQDTVAWAIMFLTHGIKPLENTHGSSEPQPVLAFNADAKESGMRDRTPQDATRVSLLNGQNFARFTADGSLNSLLFSRKADPNAKGVIDILVQRIEEIDPPPPNASAAELSVHLAEIQFLLASAKPIPMGAKAFIYLDDSGHLQLAVPSPFGTDTLPAWLSAVQGELPDGTDLHAVLPAQFEFPATHPDLPHSYRLVDTNADWGELNAATAQLYPTRACSYDVYHFLPSSGFNGLLGVLQLGSRIEKVCAVHGTIGPGNSNWSQPQDCFCFSENGSLPNNSNCGSTVP